MKNEVEQFARDGYIVLDNFFNEDELDLAWKEVVINSRNSWSLATLPYKKEDGSLVWKPYYSPLFSENTDDMRKCMEVATETAKTSTGMCYVFVRTTSQNNSKPLCDLLLSKINLLGEITGELLNNFHEVFVSCYEQGCFLSPHTDEFSKADPIPKIAFVLNLTKEWRWEWGGLLHLLDKSPWEKGIVVKVVKPSYNSLAIFKLPRWHFVSEVAASAGTKRLAFTGWLNFIPETS